MHLGAPSKSDGVTFHQTSGVVSFERYLVTVGLWELLPENPSGNPVDISGMNVGTVGGPAAIDRIRLSRTTDDVSKSAGKGERFYRWRSNLLSNVSAERF